MLLEAHIHSGKLKLAWRGKAKESRILVERQGTFTALATQERRFELHASSDYRVQVLNKGELSNAFTINHGRLEEAAPKPLQLAEMQKVFVMPQSGRVTAYWQTSPGFVDHVELQLAGRLLQATQSHVLIDNVRDGVTHQLSVTPVFAGRKGTPRRVSVICAKQGEERRANAAFPQAHFVYALTYIGDELDPFATTERSADRSYLVCMHCQRPVTWTNYVLRCTGCSAEYIANGLGTYLAVDRLRFGTCACCLPKRALIQTSGPILCAHSLKAHDSSGALAPQQVFDAAAIDDLLDRGLAEITANGIHRSMQ